MEQDIVIVGAGHCGGTAALALREAGWQGGIVLVGEEPVPPYQRPPLSKDFLAGRVALERMLLKPEGFYAERGVTLRTGTRAVAIDRAARTVDLADGSRIGYGKLLLATGSRARRLPLPGGDLPNAHVVRTVADVEKLRAGFGQGRRLVIVGAGYIGLEVAAVAVEAGMEVTVLEAAPRVLQRVASPELSAFVTEVHAGRGVRILCGVAVTGLDTAHGAVTGVLCGDDLHPADLLVVGIGVEPDTALAAAAGIACDNGIVVDACCRTSDEQVYAAGDCTNHPNALLGRRVRLESVQNAVDQGKAAAANLCGQTREYAESPWFWSNQFDLRLQLAGIVENIDTTVRRPGPAENAFLLFHLRDGAVRAVEAVNQAREFLACRKLVAQSARVDPARLADPSVALGSLP